MCEVCAKRARRWREVGPGAAAELGQLDLDAHRSLPREGRSVRFQETADEHIEAREFLRGISKREMLAAFEVGEVISREPTDDFGLVRVRILGYVKVAPKRYRPIHVWAQYNPAYPELWFIYTAYDPSSRAHFWSADYRQKVCWCNPDHEENDRFLSRKMMTAVY